MKSSGKFRTSDLNTFIRGETRTGSSVADIFKNVKKISFGALF